MAKREELTLDEALSDPMILALVRADRADPAKLRREWQPLVERFTRRETQDAGPRGAANGEGAPGDADLTAWRGLLQDCLCASRTRSVAGRGRGMM